jgi:hypothetical protein
MSARPSFRAIPTSPCTCPDSETFDPVERHLVLTAVTTRTMKDEYSCRFCHLGIVMRYAVGGQRSTSQGYWSHVDTVVGIAADVDHDALR